MNGAGAAGLSISQVLIELGATNIIICDTIGSIYKDRTENMNNEKVSNLCSFLMTNH